MNCWRVRKHPKSLPLLSRTEGQRTIGIGVVVFFAPRWGITHHAL